MTNRHFTVLCVLKRNESWSRINTYALFNSARVLGVTIRGDFKWNDHISTITIKAAKRLYLLRQPLKRVGVSSSDLVMFYCSVIRSVLEYSCQLFHSSLPNCLSDELERIQRRAMLIIFPDLKYSSALEKSCINTLYERRVKLSYDLFKDIINIKDHKPVSLLPPKATNTRQLRKPKMFSVPVCKTDRLRNSFIVTHNSSL